MGWHGLVQVPVFVLECLVLIAFNEARLRVVRQLGTEREQLRVTLTSIGDAVIATDAEGRVRFLNGVAETLTGWRQKQADGRPLREVFVIVNEQTRRPVENPVERVLRDGQVVGLANHTLLLRRGGGESSIDDSAAPIRNAKGTTVGVVLVFRDVGESRRAQEVAARLAAIVESSEDAIVGKTLDGIITSWNPAAERLFGHSAGEAVGRPLSMLVPPDHPD
jgi:PAS domain S-box-containing protein